jgi:hypothetical protein
LYKIQAGNDQKKGIPGDIEADKWNKIKDGIRDGKSFDELKSISDKLTQQIYDDQKKRMSEGVKKPSDVDQKDWDSIVSKIKDGSLRKLAEAKKIGTGDKINGDLWNKMIRDFAKKKGGATIRRPLRASRTVRHV